MAMAARSQSSLAQRSPLQLHAYSRSGPFCHRKVHSAHAHCFVPQHKQVIPALSSRLASAYGSSPASKAQHSSSLPSTVCAAGRGDDNNNGTPQPHVRLHFKSTTLMARLLMRWGIPRWAAIGSILHLQLLLPPYMVFALIEAHMGWQQFGLEYGFNPYSTSLTDIAPLSTFLGMVGVNCVQQLLQHAERDRMGAVVMDEGASDFGLAAVFFGTMVFMMAVMDISA